MGSPRLLGLLGLIAHVVLGMLLRVQGAAGDTSFDPEDPPRILITDPELPRFLLYALDRSRSRGQAVSMVRTR